MRSPYLIHITLTTGDSRKSPRSEVGDDTLALVAPWLAEILSSGDQRPLPAQELAHFSASATVQDGGLVCTLWAPAGPHHPGRAAPGRLPMVTFGVAQRSRQGADLWALLVAQFGAVPGIRKPAEPWCGVVVHEAAGAYRGDLHWVGDFERCVAWAWITRHPIIGAVDG